MRQRKQITESDADQTITLDAEGWSLARIAERLCFDAETVRQPLKQRGARNGQPNCCPSISGMTRSAKDRVSRATPPRSSRASASRRSGGENHQPRVQAKTQTGALIRRIERHSLPNRSRCSNQPHTW